MTQITTNQCNQTTKRGKPCRWNLANGPCLTHSLSAEQLSKRNSKVAQCHTLEHLAEIGKRGYKALIRKYQKNGTSEEEAKRKAHEVLFESGRTYRLASPSSPELRMINWLEKHNLEYEREWRISDDYFYTCDFFIPEKNWCVEVTSFGKSFFRNKEREEGLTKKRNLVEELGYRLIFVRMQA